MIVEVIYRLLLLDVGWFIGLFMNNLLWVFIFYATANILDSSKTFFGKIGLFLVFVFDVFTELSFAQITGWAFLGAGFLSLLYISRLAVSILAENTPALKKHMLKIVTVHWLTVYVFYNVFLR